MQRLVNEKDHVVEDMLEGYVQAKSYIEYGGSEKRVVKYTDIPVSYTHLDVYKRQMVES